MLKLVFCRHRSDPRQLLRFVVGDFRSIFELYHELKGQVSKLKVFDLSGNEVDPTNGLAEFQRRCETTVNE